jgi:CRP-like cAMP-binding protein
VPTETLSLSRQDFDILVKRHFALRDKLDRSLARAGLLRRIPLFAELTGLQIQHVAAKLQEEHLEGGVVFVRQGELGEAFFVIESGRVEVFASGDGGERAVVERGAGEYVGEIALLLDVPRTASVRTLEPTSLLVLQKADFEPLVREHLFISRGLEQESSRRMIDLRRVVPQASS